MRKNKKCVLCSGLAFADAEDMEMLHQYALDGWIFKEFKGLCYILYKEEPQDLIFSYDMQKVEKQEHEDYVRLFEEAGWHEINCKDDMIHFFYAHAGTPALHTDRLTRIEQFKMPFYIALLLLVAGIILLLGSIFDVWSTGMAGLGGGLIGGGGMLCIGCACRLKGRRWKAAITMKQAVWITIAGIICKIASIPMKPLVPLISKGLSIIALMLIMYGTLFIIAQYRVFKDKKEIGGKLK